MVSRPERETLINDLNRSIRVKSFVIFVISVGLLPTFVWSQSTASESSYDRMLLSNLLASLPVHASHQVNTVGPFPDRVRIAVFEPVQSQTAASWIRRRSREVARGHW